MNPLPPEFASVKFSINKKPIYYINKYLVNFEETKKKIEKWYPEIRYAMFLTDKYYVMRLINKYTDEYNYVIKNPVFINLNKCYNMIDRLMFYREYRLDKDQHQIATRIAQQNTDQSNLTN